MIATGATFLSALWYQLGTAPEICHHPDFIYQSSEKIDNAVEVLHIPTNPFTTKSLDLRLFLVCYRNEDKTHFTVAQNEDRNKNQ